MDALAEATASLQSVDAAFADLNSDSTPLNTLQRIFSSQLLKISRQQLGQIQAAVTRPFSDLLLISHDHLTTYAVSTDIIRASLVNQAAQFACPLPDAILRHSSPLLPSTGPEPLSHNSWQSFNFNSNDSFHAIKIALASYLRWSRSLQEDAIRNALARAVVPI